MSGRQTVMRPLVKLARKPTKEGMKIVNTICRFDLVGGQSGKTSLSDKTLGTADAACVRLPLLVRSAVVCDLVRDRVSSSIASSVCVKVIDAISGKIERLKDKQETQ
jgi:hypothetical protein